MGCFYVYEKLYYDSQHFSNYAKGTREYAAFWSYGEDELSELEFQAMLDEVKGTDGNWFDVSKQISHW